MSNEPVPPIILFGYDSSPFTNKIKLALKLRQISYTFILVPSMMPRPVLLSSFNLTYRKIPVLAIGTEIYIDTSLILETLATHPSYPPSQDHPPLHSSPQHRTLTRLLSSHYTDRPLFRTTTGLIPQAVWETSFGTDRANLIGHKLNAQKLGTKVPSNLAVLDTHLSILEPLFSGDSAWKWVLGTDSPTALDISLFYQLDWGMRISRGEGIEDLTGGGTRDGTGEGTALVTDPDRYPGLHAWFRRAKTYFEDLPSVETRIERKDEKAINKAISSLNAYQQSGPVPMLETPPTLTDLNERNGLILGRRVSIAPDDTGRDSPTLGTLVGLNTEEVVIVPDLVGGRKASVEGARVHFPRVGFVVRPIGDEKSGNVGITVGVEKAKL